METAKLFTDGGSLTKLTEKAITNEAVNLRIIALKTHMTRKGRFKNE